MELTSSIFTKKIQHEIKNLSEGKITLPHEEYLNVLIDLMIACESGFGTNINEFNENWEHEKGKAILAINKKQKEGFLEGEAKTKKEFEYIRIFFVVGENQQLTDDDKKLIKRHLESFVKVFVVFDLAWKHLFHDTDEHKNLDFAVLRIDGCPTLMTSKFAEKETEGVFFTDPNEPQKHFETFLGKILIESNCPYIFIAQLNKNNGEIDLGPLDEWGLEGLTSRLGKIYLNNQA